MHVPQRIQITLNTFDNICRNMPFKINTENNYMWALSLAIAYHQKYQEQSAMGQKLGLGVILITGLYRIRIKITSCELCNFIIVFIFNNLFNFPYILCFKQQLFPFRKRFSCINVHRKISLVWKHTCSGRGAMHINTTLQITAMSNM